MVAVMYGGGLRLQEMLDLLPRDIDMDTCSIRVRRGKGGKSRVVGIDSGSCADLAAWLEYRKTLGLTGRHPVFAAYSSSTLGNPVSQRYVRAALARAAEKAGIEKRVHPHGLRHSHAFGLAQRGVELWVIQRQLGHASLAATGTYIGHLSNADVVDRMRDQPDWTQG